MALKHLIQTTVLLLRKKDTTIPPPPPLSPPPPPTLDINKLIEHGIYLESANGIGAEKLELDIKPYDHFQITIKTWYGEIRIRISPISIKELNKYY